MDGGGFGVGFSGFGLRVECRGLRVEGAGMRVEGVGLGVLCFGFRGYKGVEDGVVDRGSNG